MHYSAPSGLSPFFDVQVKANFRGASCPAMLRIMDPLHATIEEFAADGYTH
jgi:hypothetical protein